MTSHDVVAAARRLFRARRVGHTGTLDPDATGVLVLCLGQATRLAEYLSAAWKHYVAEVVFGKETDTQDASGQTLSEQDASHLTEADIRALLPRFQGTIQQIPPMVSAVHHQGRRLYELAREGVTVERAPRAVQIESLELLAFEPGAHPVATLAVTCSTGTYIRTLSADLGAAAGVGGLMRALRRIWVGKSEAQAFTLAEAWTLDALRAQPDRLEQAILPMKRAVVDWPKICLESGPLMRLRSGQWLALDSPLLQPLTAIPESLWTECAASRQMSGAVLEPVAILDSEGELRAVGRMAEGRLYPIKVLMADESV